MSTNEDIEQQAQAVMTKYVLAACATGAVPVPAVSVAIIAENTLMINHIASIYGLEISLQTIAASFGTLGTVNMIGRQVFVEAARLLSWGAAFTGAPLLVSALGAGTAGLQTYLLGLIAIEIAKRGGKKLSQDTTVNIVRNGKKSFESFRKAAAAA